MNPIKLLKEISLKCAKESINSDYEVSHLNNVVFYTKKLTKKRNLDLEISLLVAYCHDLGRTKDGIIGKGHSIASSKYCTYLLNKRTILSNKKIKKIANAILLHPKKKTINGRYCELIKDADSLAHHREGALTDSDWAENYRVQASKIPNLDIIVSPIDKWFEIWKSNFMFLLEDLNLPDTYSVSWVHKKRIAIRQLKIINNYFIKLDNKNHDLLKNLNSILNKYFHCLENPRKYYVLGEIINTINSDLSIVKQMLNKDFKQSTQEIQLFLNEEKILVELNYILGMSKTNLILPTDKIISKHKLDLYWAKKFKNYVKLMANSGVESAEDLHNARVLGKTFKYLYDLGLIDFSSKQLYPSISNFHKLSGDLHDLDDFIDYYNKNLSIDIKTETDLLEIKNLESDLFKKSSQIIFFFKLLNNNF